MRRIRLTPFWSNVFSTTLGTLLAAVIAYVFAIAVGALRRPPAAEIVIALGELAAVVSAMLAGLFVLWTIGAWVDVTLFTPLRRKLGLGHIEPVHSSWRWWRD